MQWLEEHGPFGVLIDGSNLALYGQNWAHGGFDFAQIGAAYDHAVRPVPGPQAVGGECSFDLNRDQGSRLALPCFRAQDRRSGHRTGLTQGSGITNEHTLLGWRRQGI